MNVTPTFARRLDELSAASDRVWIVGMTTGLALTVLAAYAPLPPMGGTALAYLSLMIRASLYLWAGSALEARGGAVLARIFQLGVVAGLFELVVDWWLVNGVSNGRLDYLGKPDVVLLASPIWMPLAWACVVVELGYPAVRLFGLLRSRLGARGAALLASASIAISAGVTVGIYEVLAARAGWWRYSPAHAMIGPSCALFIPVGEMLMFLAILPVAARTLSREDRPVASAIVSGAIFAAAIFGGYALAYLLLELGRVP
jgi:hypothetical protein